MFGDEVESEDDEFDVKDNDGKEGCHSTRHAARRKHPMRHDRVNSNAAPSARALTSAVVEEEEEEEEEATPPTDELKSDEVKLPGGEGRSGRARGRPRTKIPRPVGEVKRPRGRPRRCESLLGPGIPGRGDDDAGDINNNGNHDIAERIDVGLLSSTTTLSDFVEG